MILQTISDLKNALIIHAGRAKSIGIVTHQNPDGDGLPACIALKIIFKELGYESAIVLEEQAPNTYDFLQAKSYTITMKDEYQFDFLILLDCHEKKRIGNCSVLVDRANNVITIDHHPPIETIQKASCFFDVDIVCAGAIIYKLFSDEMKMFTPDKQNYLANAFYTTVLNDTDNFMNANVDEYTFQFCSELMKYSLNPGIITQEFLFKKKPNEMRFIGEVLATIDLKLNQRVLFMHSTKEMLDRNALTDDATTKLTRWVKGVENVLVVVYFRETETGSYRLSLRSNFINVNIIAAKYNGGGHIKAAGCEIIGSLQNVKNEILKDIQEQMR
jgi:phosphoesterase RecJ-like protein